MGTRNLLHINQLNSFTNWLKKDGWVIQKPKGMYEALRATKGKRWIIVYRRLKPKEHLSLCDRDCDIVRQFLKSEDKRKITNYQRIKEMSIEEMARECVYFVPNNTDFHYTGLSGKYKKTSAAVIEDNIEWLESEVTE